MELVGEDVDELMGLGDTLLVLDGLGSIDVGGMGCILGVLEEVGEDTSGVVEGEVSVEGDEDEDEGDEEGVGLDGKVDMITG